MSVIWLGTSGFRYKEWRPAFYPAELPEPRFLSYYAAHFNSVEIDSTFYRMPNAKMIDGWKSATGEDFRFSLKASQQITHREQLRLPSPALDYLLGVVARLERRLGVLLYQLPPFFRFDAARLETFLSFLPREMRAAMEFRHDSWFRAETYDLLREREVALCIHDADDHVTPLEFTAPFTYVRLRRNQYDPAVMSEWQQRIHDWAAGGREVYAYVKHEADPNAALLAQEFAHGAVY
jgi:uncharacterized protein YecE (DUF72 family)